MEQIPTELLLLLLEQQIQGVEATISRVQTQVKEVRSTKPDGWQDQHAYLRDKKTQLKQKMLQQLKHKLRNREEKLQMVKVELQLMHLLSNNKS